MPAADFTITLHNPKDDTDEQIAERVELNNVISKEAVPDEPPTRVEDAIASLRAAPERHRRWSFRARDAEGRLVGIGSTSIDPEHDDNPDMLFAGIHVLAEYRRQGLGSQLLAKLVEVAEAEGRKRLVSSTHDRLPAGGAFAETLGAKPQLQQHINQLRTEDVDRGELERWVTEGPSRAPGYELVAWDGAVPDEYMEQYLDLVLVMNTAPRDDLQMNDFTITAEQVRESERVFEAAGGESWTVVARRVEDDAWAGFHDVTWQPSDPETVWVGSTGVRPEHRGHALGKWLKATVQLRVMDERPQVKQVRTGNADSNDAMLGINHAMGYKPWIATSTWELATADARAYLTARGL